MKKVAFLGLGNMGTRMVKNLIRAGYSPLIWNRSKEKTLELTEMGAIVFSTPAEAAAEADVVITMLSQDQAVKEVLLGVNGVMEKITEGKTVIDCSTVSPITSRELFRLFAQKGVEFLDAPVTGSISQAEEGNLVFIVGGRREGFEKCEALFQAMGKSWVYMGESGAGSTAKLANNTIASINLIALMEGVSIAREGGINLEDFIKVISGGAAQSRMIDRKAGKILSGDYTPQFAAALMDKDLGLAMRMCEELRIVTPLLGLSKQLFRMTVNKGHGSKDISAVYELYKEWSGEQSDE